MLTPDNPYYRQVRLLVAVLPFVAREGCFALKGGTAINLFVRDMPRLSVDIDLAFVALSDRMTALREIDAALRRIAAAIEHALPGVHARISKEEAGKGFGLLVRAPDAQIKVEVSPVLRGTVYAPSTRRIVASAEREIGFAEVAVLSEADLYAGKIVAALDRQHPRDLFDVMLLLATEGISEALFRAFLVYAASHDGSLARILDPRPKPLADLFERQFRNMIMQPVALADLEAARTAMIRELHRRIDERAKAFLLSFKRGGPDWTLLGLAHVKDLPAIRWKLQNLDEMAPAKRQEAIATLEEVLSRIGTA
jgi:hypothetical protein